jgi:excinuclease UvrABC ATPase subunit
MRRGLILASLLLFVATGFAVLKQSRSLKPVGNTPSLTRQVEYCLTCHADLPVISQSHPVETFGCVLCHGGEPMALTADLAHSTLRGGGNPSDLAVVEASCGGEKCHNGTPQVNRDHIQRVATSLQATYAGAIAQVRYAFGAQPDLTARMGV